MMTTVATPIAPVATMNRKSMSIIDAASLPDHTSPVPGPEKNERIWLHRLFNRNMFYSAKIGKTPLPFAFPEE
jgi:hypothetical protein